MNATREEAEKVAAELPTGFGLITISALISIIYYTLQLWKACYTSPKYVMGENGHNSGMLRLANRRTRRAVRHHKANLSKSEIAQITSAALDHVAALSEERFAVCRGESYAAELDEVSMMTPDEDDEPKELNMTLEEKLARIKELSEKNPPTEAEIEAAADQVLAELEAKEAGKEVPVQGLGTIIGAAIIGGLISRR